jgi:hypothetical protein
VAERNAARLLDAAGWFERLVLEVMQWRMELEWRLMGAILRVPWPGLLRAIEAGVSEERFDRDDMRLLFTAVRAAQRGVATDKTRVLLMAIAAMKYGGYWRPDALASERGMNWSERNLVSLACGLDGPADVPLYAAQLIDLDERVRRARALWREMVEQLKGVGETRLERRRS